MEDLEEELAKTFSALVGGHDGDLAGRRGKGEFPGCLAVSFSSRIEEFSVAVLILSERRGEKSIKYHRYPNSAVSKAPALKRLLLGDSVQQTDQ